MRELGGLDTDAVETERGDFRLRREKWFALRSSQFFFPTLLFFSLDVRTTLPTTTAGTVIHPWAGDLFCGLSDSSGEERA